MEKIIAHADVIAITAGRYKRRKKQSSWMVTKTIATWIHWPLLRPPTETMKRLLLPFRKPSRSHLRTRLRSSEPATNSIRTDSPSAKPPDLNGGQEGRAKLLTHLQWHGAEETPRPRCARPASCRLWPALLCLHSLGSI